MFIELTKTDGIPVFINLDNVTCFYECNDVTKIFFASEMDDCLNVKESTKEIWNLKKYGHK